MSKARKIRDGVFLLGAIDWDRRLFDALIPLPEGTSYNAYLVRGKDKTVLLDTVDPAHWKSLEAQLAEVPAVDHIVIHHVEQDHSGSLPFLLERYPQATMTKSATPSSLPLRWSSSRITGRASSSMRR